MDQRDRPAALTGKEGRDFGLRRLCQVFDAFLEALREVFRSLLIEDYLRRELRRPLLEKSKPNRPYARNPASLGRYPVVIDPPVVGTCEHLNKKLSHAKRRNLRISGRSSFPD